MKKILTGSREFFSTDNGDFDYLVIQKQDVPFKHIRNRKGCEFHYNDVSKQELFEWHKTKNNWEMNVTSFVSREFLEHFKIDIFGEDRETVCNLMKRAFMFNYGAPRLDGLSKYIYKFFIFARFIDKGTYSLEPIELEDAFKLKSRVYDNKALLNYLYNFYSATDSQKESVFKRLKL